MAANPDDPTLVVDCTTAELPAGIAAGECYEPERNYGPIRNLYYSRTPFDIPPTAVEIARRLALFETDPADPEAMVGPLVARVTYSGGTPEFDRINNVNYAKPRSFSFALTIFDTSQAQYDFMRGGEKSGTPGYFYGVDSTPYWIGGQTGLTGGQHLGPGLRNWLSGHATTTDPLNSQNTAAKRRYIDTIIANSYFNKATDRITLAMLPPGIGVITPGGGGYFASLTGSPYDNAALAEVLNGFYRSITIALAQFLAADLAVKAGVHYHIVRKDGDGDVEVFGVQGTDGGNGYFSPVGFWQNPATGAFEFVNYNVATDEVTPFGGLSLATIDLLALTGAQMDEVMGLTYDTYGDALPSASPAWSHPGNTFDAIDSSGDSWCYYCGRYRYQPGNALSGVGPAWKRYLKLQE